MANFLKRLFQRADGQSPDTSGMNFEVGNWAVAQYTDEDGLPIVVKHLSHSPSAAIRAGLQHLAVIRWPYDGSTNNGLPTPEDNERMNQLEDNLEKLETPGRVMLAYTKTGNGLKEFAIRCQSQEEFMEALNQGLAGQPVYPIEIDLYEDPDWQDFDAFMKSLY